MRLTKKAFLLEIFRSFDFFPVGPSSSNSFHSTNEQSRIVRKSRSANCSRIAPAPVEISRFRNLYTTSLSLLNRVKKSGMLSLQDWISYSNEPRNRKKVGFLAMGLAKEKLG